MRLKRSMMVIMMALLTAALGACASAEEDAGSAETADASKGKDLVLAIGGEPDEGFDPTTGWGQYGSPLFQSTLLTYDEDLAIQKDLATDYHVSDDGLEWTIAIREDVQFSDGEDLTARDVVFTYKTAQTSGSVIDLSNVKSIEKADAHTMTFTLKEPDSTFIDQLARIGIVPEHAYDEAYNEHPIGSGPFQLVEWRKGQQLIVEANPHYYGDPPNFEKLTFLFLEEDAAFAAAQAGEADVAAVPPSLADETVEGMRLVDLQSVDNRGVMLPYPEAGGETEEGYPLGNAVTSDRAIRKAMNIAVDREGLVDGVLEGYGTPAYTIADDLPWWNPDTVIEDNRLADAKRLLAEAGWQENDAGVREKDGVEASFTLYYPSDDHIRQSLALAFASQMEPLGLSISTEGKSWDELERLMPANPVMMGYGNQTPLEMYHTYSSHTKAESLNNANYYSNPDVDRYMEQAMRATSQEAANAFWKKAQWDGETGFTAKGDAPWVWLVNIEHTYFIKDDLKIGEQRIQPHGHGWPITDAIENWHWQDAEEG
ncbi:ABC transporter substrate-binding protein [Barrientosiimonas marina]|uniref:ABC transporter substrate-binding protein n=2 Tax=Lentibacillus kimchii TaxID=1542911 RepID=A0ABW2UWB4_9BACI